MYNRIKNNIAFKAKRKQGFIIFFFFIIGRICNKLLNPFYKLFNERYLFTKTTIQSFIYKNHILIETSIPCLVTRPPILTNTNWGDDISLVIAELLSKRKALPYKYILKKGNKIENYLCVGSIITWLSNENSIIWGAGVLSSMNDMTTKPKKVLAVSGPLTREYLLNKGIDCPQVYGDPALLFPMFYKPGLTKKYKIGFIPHFLDLWNHSVIRLLEQYQESEINIIDITNYGHYKDFINRICECDLIVSSSLHGIIVSDAYGVPNVWCEFSYKMDDSGFKFQDYFLSVGKGKSKPLIFDSFLPFDEIYALKDKWIKPSIDLEKLLKSCPFYSIS